MLSSVRFDIVTTQESDRWDEVLREIGSYSHYQLAALHRLSEMRGEGIAVMPVFRDDCCIIAFPLIFRDIDLSLMQDSGLRDATSVAGFAGPVASTSDVPEQSRSCFHEALQDYLDQEGIISVYSRLHPLLPQLPILESYGSTVDVGVTLSIDLTQPPDVQIASYERHTRQDISRLKRRGLLCHEVGPECLDDFVRVYYDSMDRVGADSVYYFERPYFEFLVREMPEVMRMHVCLLDDRITSVLLIASCNGIVETLLSGTDHEYLRLSPAKLLKDAARQWGVENGMHTLHLGGGVRAQRDSLYTFKKSYGAIDRVYRTWRHVVNQDMYDELCRQVSGGAPSKYFPTYRDPAFSSTSERCVEVSAL